MNKFAVIEKDARLLNALIVMIRSKYPFYEIDSYDDVNQLVNIESYSAIFVNESTYRFIMIKPQTRKLYGTGDDVVYPLVEGSLCVLYFKLSLKHDLASVAKHAVRLDSRDKLRVAAEMFTSDVFAQNGLKRSLAGYSYLKDAVEACFFDSTLMHKGVTKRLYPMIAEKYKVRAESVERSIRHMLTSAYREAQRYPGTVSDDVLRGPRCPSNSAFLAHVLERLTLFMRVNMYEDN